MRKRKVFRDEMMLGGREWLELLLARIAYGD